MSSTSVAETLLSHVSKGKEYASAKVSVIGTGQVGMAAAFSMVTQGILSELALVDALPDKLRGEMMDLQHGQAFLHTVKVHASTDYEVTKGSKICVVTAGVRQKEGESRLALVHRNVEIYQTIIPQLVKYSPDATLIIASNPVDVLTYVAWKLSGLPKSKVFGSGTMLDSSRFRFLISERLKVAPLSVHGYIIGEHGDSSVPVWSSVNVAGARLRDINENIAKPGDPERWEKVHQDVVSSAYEIIKLKGYTSWAIGVMLSTLCNVILKNQRMVYTLSTPAKGFHGISKDVCLSLPVVVGDNGITSVLSQHLDDDEMKKVRDSAETLHEIITTIKI